MVSLRRREHKYPDLSNQEHHEETYGYPDRESAQKVHSLVQGNIRSNTVIQVQVFFEMLLSYSGDTFHTHRCLKATKPLSCTAQPCT